MSLYKHKQSQFWWCRFKIRGQTFRLSTGKTDRRAATAKETELRADKQREVPAKRRGAGSLLTLATWDADRAATEGTTEAYQNNLERLWANMLMDLNVMDPVDVTAEALVEYVRGRRAKKCRGQTIVRELAAMHRGLEEALRRKWIAELPDFPKVKRDPKDPAQSGKCHDPWAAVAVLATVPDDVREACTVALATGIRFQELRRVVGEWVKAAPPKAKVPGVIAFPDSATKSRRARTVGVPSYALDILLRRARENGTGPLFPRAGYRKALWRASQKLGYAQTVTLRDLRHTFATYAIRKGGNIVDLARALGHAKLDTTWIYMSPDDTAALDLGAD